MNILLPPSNFHPLIPGHSCGMDCRHARHAGAEGIHPDWLWCELPGQSARLRSLDPADDCARFSPRPTTHDASAPARI